jgi:hypothetical protein
MITSLILISCAPSLTPEQAAQEAKVRAQFKIKEGRIRFSESDGLSQATAVVITGCLSSNEGIVAEDFWISGKHGMRDTGWRKVGQALLGSNRQMFDRIDIELVGTSEKISYYFDISDFF